jgi:TRAP-type C4-dicarboxylate transport system substrate-binding protein
VKTIHITLLAALLFVTPLTAQEYTIKFATIVPEGSTWLNVMHEYDESVRKESNGRLGFRIYAGGVLGDEKDVLRKMRLGQLHSAGFTGLGLGEILPEVRILDAPLLFRSYEEVDYVSTRFWDRFAKGFEEKGYVALGWSEAGFVYVFTKKRVSTLDEMKGVKMWMWEGDPVSEATFKAFGIVPIPLSIVDVNTSLQTGLIDGVYVSPLGALALQWWTRVKYMLDLPLADAAGAILITKKMFDKLPPDLQEILVRNGRKYTRILTELAREENEKARSVLQENGITIVSPPDPKEVEQIYETGRKARRMLVGKLYSEELLQAVENAVMEFRQTQLSNDK